MDRPDNTEIIDRFLEFYRTYCADDIGQLAQAYPNDRKSLYLDWEDLYRFDRDMAEDYVAKPGQMQDYAEEALRLYDLPADVKLGNAHVRMTNLGETTGIREIRERHHGNLISVQGTVNKATSVRPKLQEAAFECQRCGTLSYIPQHGGFTEPHQCEGCERQGPFNINFEQSEFVDAQTLRVQESPEGLRGGQTPEAIDINIEDDVTGEVTAGDHVRVTGILRLEQQGNQQEKSLVFEKYMDGIAVEIEDEEFDEMDITEADKQEIIELSNDPDIYDKMVQSMAPSIWGYETHKLAIIFQLFSGVTKHLPDSSRIRGDMHMLLIGDPGTGKCVDGDTRVTLVDGTEPRIRELVEANLSDPKPVDDGVWDEVDFAVPSMADDGSLTTRRVTKVWKREAPDWMFEITTRSGRNLMITPSHPLFVAREGAMEAVAAEDIESGEFVATPGSLHLNGHDELDIPYRRSRANNAVRLDAPEELTPWFSRLLGYIVAEGYVQDHESGGGTLYVTNNDREILDDVTESLERLGLNPSERSPHDGKEAREIVCSSSELVSFLAELEPAILEESAAQRVPGPVMRATGPVKRAFLRAYIDSEGTVSSKQRSVVVGSMSRELLAGVRTLLLSFSIETQLRERARGSYRLRISGADFTRFVNRIGFITERKRAAAEEFVDGSSNPNRDIVPVDSERLRDVREALGLTQRECGLPRSTYQHYERGDRRPSHESLRTVLDAFETTAETAAIADGGTDIETELSTLNALASEDLSWDRIESIKPVEPSEEWVYDLEVEGTHNYLTNGVISHNSQLLQYVKDIAPRSVYTSGKGSSAAGLCVTGDTLIHTEDGFRSIGELARKEHPDPVDADTGAERELGVYTYDRETGETDLTKSSHIWRMPEKDCRRIETAYGKELEASIDTPVLVCDTDGIEWRPISEVDTGDYVAVPRYWSVERSTPSPTEYLELTDEKLRLTDDSIEFLRDRLYEEYGTLRDAAAELDLPEDFIYDSLPNRFVPQDRLDRVLEGINSTRAEVSVRQAMLRHGDDVRLPKEFDADLLYLVGLVFGDGDISVSPKGGNRGTVRISNNDESLLRRAASIMGEKFGKCPQIEYRKDRVPCIRLNSATIARFFRNLGMRSPKVDLELDERLTNAEHADAFLRGLFDADGCISARSNGGSSIQYSTISGRLAEQVQLMLETYGVRAQSRDRDRRGETTLPDGRTITSKHVQTHLTIYGRDIEVFADAIGFRTEEKQASLESLIGEVSRDGARVPVGDTLARVVPDGGIGEYYMNFNRGDHPGRTRAREITEEFDLGPVHDDIVEAATGDIYWDEVTSVEDTGEKEVYDLTVPETHNFLGNGLVVHNTATAVRDDFGEGDQWSLEAGALVLADKGIAAVDELDKMDAGDRSAMHEALEQQSISVSKAGINATLKSRCSLLGAANPKYGRFDEYEAIPEQIDLEPALISRFDLIFTITDKPDEEEDRRLARHIIETNYAGELHTHRENVSTANVSETEVAAATEDVEPVIDPELLRKYVAHAKRSCYPTMTDEARGAIEEFYVDLRSHGEGEDAPVPVTARKLEALVRLAEASARVRLSDTVEQADADRVIDIVRKSLEDVGMDPETNEFDADMIEAGHSKSQRDRIKGLKAIIQELEEEYEEGAPYDEVIGMAVENGTDRDKAEHEIEKLKQKGEVYEPSQGHLRTT